MPKLKKHEEEVGSAHGYAFDLFSVDAKRPDASVEYLNYVIPELERNLREAKHARALLEIMVATNQLAEGRISQTLAFDTMVQKFTGIEELHHGDWHLISGVRAQPSATVAPESAPGKTLVPYLAFVLSDDCRNVLLEMETPVYGRTVCHHVTLIPPMHGNSLSHMNEAVAWWSSQQNEIVATGYACGEGVDAFAVTINDTAYDPQGRRYHLTLSLDKGHQAKEAGKLNFDTNVTGEDTWGGQVTPLVGTFEVLYAKI